MIKNTFKVHILACISIVVGLIKDSRPVMVTSAIVIFICMVILEIDKTKKVNKSKGRDNYED